MKLDPNAPAYPVECDYVDGVPRGRQTHLRSGFEVGLTVRQMFAAMAMQQLCDLADLSYEKIAEMAVKQADALIAELNKEQA